MGHRSARYGISRRGVLVLGGGLAGAATLPAVAQVAPRPITELYHNDRAALLKGRTPKLGRIQLDIPRLAESGNSVPLEVKVASPMTAADHVRRIHILSEKNPVATIAVFTLSPRSGRAEVKTNIRLAATQNVHAFAEMSDGSIWMASSEVVVLLAACVDGG